MLFEFNNVSRFNIDHLELFSKRGQIPGKNIDPNLGAERYTASKKNSCCYPSLVNSFSLPGSA